MMGSKALPEMVPVKMGFQLLVSVLVMSGPSGDKNSYAQMQQVDAGRLNHA